MCTVSANACPEFTWFKDGIKIETEPRVRIGSHSVVSPEKTTTFLTLSIEELGSADQGIYTCICRNRSKQVTIRADLFVSSSKLKRAAAYYKSTNDSVRVLRHLRNVNIEAGRCIELKVAFLKGAYFVVWYRNNKRIDLNDRMIMSESSEAETVATLTVLDSTTSDSGLYFVMSRTIEGIVQSSFAEVHVTPKPESEIEDKDTPENLTQLPIIVEMPTETGTFEKDVLRVTCKVDIDIHTIIEWQKDGISIDNNSHFVAVDYGDQYIGLRVDNSTMEDTGEYTLTLRDQQTGNTVSSSCYVIITRK